MAEEEKAVKEEMHRKFAAGLFNLVWDLMEKKERSLEEDERMLHAAHASRFHWGEAGTPLELERGEWQISRVYSILNRPESALHHARRCLEICRSTGIEDFDIAFAYEAMARACAVAGEPDGAREYLELGRKAGENISDEGNREYFLSELNTVSELLDR